MCWRARAERLTLSLRQPEIVESKPGAGATITAIAMVPNGLMVNASTTAKRSSALPDVPTLDESGLKGFDIGTWFGVLAPAATSWCA